MTHTVLFSLGSNLGNRFAHLQSAVFALSRFVSIQRISTLYETEPWGDSDQPPFLNLCVKGTSYLSPHSLLHETKWVEKELGRQATRHWGPRVIDIDILFYDYRQVSDSLLTIPHPYIPERPFVLFPLLEIAPDFIHPTLNKTIRQLTQETPKKGIVPIVERVNLPTMTMERYV